MRKLLVPGLLVFGLMIPAAAHAQTNSADMTVRANVLRPLVVTVGNALDFGDVLPGITYTILTTSTTDRGQFNVQGANGKEVTLDFGTPPTQLTGPGDPIAISFTAAYAATSGEAAPSVFNPTTGVTTTLTAANPGLLYVFLGGVIQPAVGQAQGEYTATVTLEANYTGS